MKKLYENNNDTCNILSITESCVCKLYKTAYYITSSITNNYVAWRIRTTVIISFYQKLDYLKLLLAGFSVQTESDFEVIIADDGSDAAVVEDIRKITSSYPFPIVHVWHEDIGFRKNRILNRAIAAARSEYIIFVDGDCVPHPRFVEEHLKNAVLGKVLTGRRVNMSQKMTDLLTPDDVKAGILQTQFWRLVLDGIMGDSTYVEKGLYISNEWLAGMFNRKKRGLIGCNFSLHKTALLEVNGFDERYEAPSIGEDSDIQFRLELAGKEICSINHLAVQYHLYHKLQERAQVNLDLFELVKKERTAFTPFGIKRTGQDK